jgi:predicted acyl esterase
MASILPEGIPLQKLSQPRYSVKIEKDVFVTMRDGVRVAVDVYRPDTPGRFPVLYASSCYQKDLVYLPAVTTYHCRETNDIDWFVQRGYVYINADVRGTGKSEGIWKFHAEAEQNDHYDLVEWVAGQPWSSGRVGMIGESYFGWTQWFAAAKQPPHLVTIVPFDAGADMYRDVVYHGGLLGMGFLTWWHFNLRANHLLDLPGQKGPEVMTWDMVYEVLRHPTYDDFWKERSADFSKIRIPVYSIGIWHKIGLHLRGNTRGFEELKGPKKLLVCWGEYVGDEMAIFNSLEMRLEMLRWYDHWLKDNDTGMMTEPAVRICVRNSDEGYRFEKEWPLKRTRYVPFYLHPGPAGAVDSLNDGRLSPEPPTGAESSFTFDYPNPEWSGWSGIGTAMFVKGLPDPVIKIATFSSDPLREDLEVTGPITMVLYTSSTMNDQDIYVRVVDQEPDALQQRGSMPPKGKILTRGWLKASHRERDERLSKPCQPYYTHGHPTPVEANRVYRYDIEVWPTSNLFRKEHRIRIDLSNGDSPAFDFGGHHYGLKLGQDTLYHDKDHPSHVLLPVIPR